MQRHDAKTVNLKGGVKSTGRWRCGKNYKDRERSEIRNKGQTKAMLRREKGRMTHSDGEWEEQLSVRLNSGAFQTAGL